LPGQCVITREIAVAEGVFAPGHLGELTQIVPFEMVDAVLAECGAAQRRLRKLPARVVVYLLLAAALFGECGYAAVWARLTAALGALSLPPVTATGLWHARTRLGARPLRALFDLLRGPAAAIRTAGARWAGMLVVAIDGTSLDVADAPAGPGLFLQRVPGKVAGTGAELLASARPTLLAAKRASDQVVQPASISSGNAVIQ